MDKRLNSMDYKTKVSLFHALQDVACSQNSQLEMLTLSPTVKRKLVDEGWPTDESVKMMIADVLLIGINKNEQHVKSVAVNYRKTATALPRLASTPAQQMPTPDEPAEEEELATDGQ